MLLVGKRCSSPSFGWLSQQKHASYRPLVVRVTSSSSLWLSSSSSSRVCSAGSFSGVATRRRRIHSTWPQEDKAVDTAAITAAATDTESVTTRRPTRINIGVSDGGSDENTSTRTSSVSVAFDRPMKRLQRDNAARAHRVWTNAHYNTEPSSSDQAKEATTTETTAGTPPVVVSYDYFHQEIAHRLVDRLDDIRRDEGFPLALDLGSGVGHIYASICSEDALGDGLVVADGGDETADALGGVGGVRKLVQVDSSPGMLYRDADIVPKVPGSHRCDAYRLLVSDEEFDSGPLPFPDGTFDLVISSTALHWVNNLPKLLSEARRVLKPDGCFLCAMVGGTQTLPELRASLLMAELEREGGVSNHVGPFINLSDLGGLLQRAGFALPTLDVDTMTLSYPNAAVLMEHLQRMGENSASLTRRTRTALDTFLAMACIYDGMFPADTTTTTGAGATATTDPLQSEIEATVQVIYAIGWAPHITQPKPKQRGSATHKVGEIV